MAVRQFVGAARQASAVTGIAQDNIIFAMLLFAFVVWITTKGELSTYAAFFKPASGALGPTPIPVSASSTTSSTVVPATTNPITGTQIQPGLTSNPLSGLTGGTGLLGTNILTGIQKMLGL